METKQIVMLMDFENLVIGLENNDSDTRKFFSASALLSYIEKNYGKVIYRKAFADWSSPKFRKYTSDLTRCGVEMQHIVRNGHNSKNYAETHMVIQAMDCINKNPSIDAFVLVTGDADFLPLISYLKSTGRIVIGIGTEGTVSGTLLSNCDDFILYTNEGLKKNTKQFIDKGQVIRALKTIIGNGGIYVSDLENELMNDMPDFNPQDFDCDDFIAFLEMFPAIFKLSDGEEETLVHLNITNKQLRYQYSTESRLQQSDTQNTPLEKYMKDTRWYIADGPTREAVLTNIYDILAEDNRIMASDALRQDACAELDVEDKPWQGTIFSLVCGSCLWEKPESSDVPLQQRKLSLYKSITNLDDFLLGYYTSLFYKAFTERTDLTPQSMTELMHPEDIDGHIDLFEKVYTQMTERK